MTTTVVGKESGITIIVEEGLKHFPTDNPFYTLFVRGGPTSGEAWLQFTLGKFIVPFLRKNNRKLDENNAVDSIWNGTEHLRISFTPSQSK